MRYRTLLTTLLFCAATFAQSPDQKPGDKKPDAAPAQTSAQKPADTADQPPPPPPSGATHVMGFESVKRNAKGNLSVSGGKLTFDRSSIDISSINDIFTGSESRQTGGAPLTLVKLAAPFGSGRALSLFTHAEYDNITIEYTDSNGGLHGAIFMMPKGKAESLKKEMVAAGAHASIPPLSDTAVDKVKEKK